MTERRSIRAVLLAVGALLSLGAMPAAQTGASESGLQVRITQVDSTEFPTVSVYVSVTDAAGEPAALDPERIVLEEGGRPVPVLQVQPLGEAVPLNTILVIDVSGSMGLIGKLEAAQDAARAFVRQMRTGERAGVIAFNTQVDLVQSLTGDPDLLLEAIGSLRAGGDTALYDAIAEAIRALASAHGRKAILVLSDGMDNSSRVSADEVLSEIGPGGASISTIGLGDPDRAPGQWAGLDVAPLRTLAGEAGGTYTYVEDRDALRGLYERLQRALQSEYVLTYTSPASLRDGVTRSLSASLVEEGGASAAQAAYNPGGLVPEVSRPAPWPVFLGALAVLVLMAIVPATAPGLLRRRREESPGSAGFRVRLQPPKEPRIRLR